MTLTLKLNDEQIAALHEHAKQLGKPIEETALIGIESFLRRTATIKESMDRIMDENAELYRRLAQ